MTTLASDTTTNRKTALLVYVFRYALGRRSTAVIDVAAELTAVAVSLPATTRDLIVREIGDAITAGRAGGTTEVKIWNNVRASLLRTRWGKP